MQVDRDVPSDDSQSSGELRRILELELIKIRNEATAARLDARAAEIEITLRRLREGTASPNQKLHDDAVVHRLDDQDHRVVHHANHSISAAKSSLTTSTSPMSRFGSWGDVRAAQSHARSTEATRAVSHQATVTQVERAQSISRSDRGHSSVKRPRLLDLDAERSEIGPNKTVDKHEPSIDIDIAPVTPLVAPSVMPLAIPLIGDPATKAPRVSTPVEIFADEDEQNENRDGRRRRPAAWLVSAVAHVAALIVLAGIGLKTQMPKDQVALSASTASANEEAIETFEIEQSEAMPESEVSEPVPSETEYEISPVGELAATEFSPDAPPSPPTAMAAAMSSAASSASSAMSMQSVSTKKMEFCGVEGGGNHFVYLVDSSGSMGDGFESARSALLASIELLTPEQRYYVVFFDADSDYMRLSNANQDEPRSVFATPENKVATKRWAMRINKDRGKAPYDPLRFALTLKPDVIFLLSDGEFPQGIEDLLKEENNVTNLFGESKPISIVHTIAYFSEEGESRMRRIAKQNLGQYRYVPKPK